MAKVEKAYELLTEGLLHGYGGDSQAERVLRGPFPIKSSPYTSSDGGEYIDEWVNGGGQEIASIDGLTVTRVHSGQPVSEEVLTELGVTKQNIIDFLIESIKQLKGRTRLDQNCNPDPDGDWLYSYQVLINQNDIGLVMGLEEIKYKGNQVFAHGFSISPVR